MLPIATATNKWGDNSRELEQLEGAIYDLENLIQKTDLKVEVGEACLSYLKKVYKAYQIEVQSLKNNNPVQLNLDNLNNIGKL